MRRLSGLQARRYRGRFAHPRRLCTHPSRGPDEAQRLLNTVPPEQRANMIADATADLEREKKESHALARHAAEKVRVAVQLVWGSDGGMAG